MTWFQWLGWIVLPIALTWAALAALGSSRWEKATRALEAQLEATRTPRAVKRYDMRELQGLPPPVQRYFRTVLAQGQPIIASARVEHAGTFNTGETTDAWKPFTSRQHVMSHRPGFVWDGRVVMLPGVPVRVHDAYVGGTGILRPAIFGLFTLMDLRGGGDVAQGELMRFFAEAAWYPTALLPSQGVRWEAVDDRYARATLVDAMLSVTLLFRFNDLGLIESARAEARGRTVGRTIVMTPWEGRWWDYQERDGMRVPMAGEVAWITAEGRKPYWRGTITSLHFEFAP